MLNNRETDKKKICTMQSQVTSTLRKPLKKSYQFLTYARAYFAERTLRPWSLGFYSVVKIQIMGSGSASMQSRLLLLLLAYGNRPSTQLRLGCCYGVFHKRIIKTSFYLETSFFFCQLEGCSTVSKKSTLREANSFAFTLTGITLICLRCYGICVNVFRPCSSFIHNKETIAEEEF